MTNLKEVKCEKCGAVLGKGTAGRRIQIVCLSCQHDNSFIIGEK